MDSVAMKVSAAIVAAMLFVTGCASPYIGNRVRDLADVATVCCGAGLGAKVRAGPVQFGALANADLVGLRGGDVFVQGVNIDSKEPPCVFEASLYGKDIYDGADTWDYLAVSKTSKRRGKDFAASGRWGLNHAESSYYYWQIEALLALGPSVRVGCNLAELVDFLVGILAIDLLNDDLDPN